MIVFHSLQVLYCFFFIFGYKYTIEKHENCGLWFLCCCICCSPLGLLICQIVALAMVGQEEDQPIYFIWVLNDTLITALSMTVFMYRTWENDRHKKRMNAENEALEKAEDKLKLEEDQEEEKAVAVVKDCV